MGLVCLVSLAHTVEGISPVDVRRGRNLAQLREDSQQRVIGVLLKPVLINCFKNVFVPPSKKKALTCCMRIDLLRFWCIKVSFIGVSSLRKVFFDTTFRQQPPCNVSTSLQSRNSLLREMRSKLSASQTHNLKMIVFAFIE